MTEHSATPWAVDDRGLIYAHDFGTTVADCQVAAWENMHAAGCSSNIPSKQIPICHANAAFIVQACNAHDELVAALRGFVEIGYYPDTIAAARAALDKAGAK